MPDAGQLEDDWDKALAAAQGAVGAMRDARFPEDEQRQEAAHVHEERKWLAGYRTTLRRLLPTRRSD